LKFKFFTSRCFEENILNICGSSRGKYSANYTLAAIASDLKLYSDTRRFQGVCGTRCRVFLDEPKFVEEDSQNKEQKRKDISFWYRKPLTSLILKA
jgi:hypothetical protein